MYVSDLIEVLKKCDQGATVTVWDPKSDWEDINVKVSQERGRRVVHIGNFVFGCDMADVDRAGGDRQGDLKI